LISTTIIDSDAANDPNSTANTAVPAEFAGVLAAEEFIGSAGPNSCGACPRFYQATPGFDQFVVLAVGREKGR
jgi:hypothetical protein